jgi:hypothetical protein
MPAATGERVLGILEDLQAELDGGAIVSVDLDLARVRILPLGGSESSV